MKKEDEASLRDMGVPPYLYKSYQDWAGRTFEALKYRFAPEMESQFKKPYFHWDHVESERELAMPENQFPYPTSPIPEMTHRRLETPLLPQPSFPGLGQRTPATLGGGNIGSAGPSSGGFSRMPLVPPSAPSPLAPIDVTFKDPCEKCVVFEFPHKDDIYHVTSEGGWIVSQYSVATDFSKLRVKACWMDDAGIIKITAHYWPFGGASYEMSLSDDKRVCLCDDRTDKEGCTSCSKCVALTIGYTSQQMGVNDPQTLTAAGGGGCYEWEILSGGGSLSESKGLSTVYTAPSSNAECASNPTIQLMDFCKTATTLKIAINAVSGDSFAIFQAFCDNYEWCGSGSECPPPPTLYYHLYTRSFLAHLINCGGTNYANCPPGDTYWGTNWLPTDVCSPQWYKCKDECIVSCPGITCPTTCAQDYPTNCNGLAEASYYDRRTAAMKTAGCCPYQLL